MHWVSYTEYKISGVSTYYINCFFLGSLLVSICTYLCLVPPREMKNSVWWGDKGSYSSAVYGAQLGSCDAGSIPGYILYSSLRRLLFSHSAMFDVWPSAGTFRTSFPLTVSTASCGRLIILLQRVGESTEWDGVISSWWDQESKLCPRCFVVPPSWWGIPGTFSIYNVEYSTGVYTYVYLHKYSLYKYDAYE